MKRIFLIMITVPLCCIDSAIAKDWMFRHTISTSPELPGFGGRRRVDLHEDLILASTAGDLPGNVFGTAILFDGLTGQQSYDFQSPRGRLNDCFGARIAVSGGFGLVENSGCIGPGRFIDQFDLNSGELVTTFRSSDFELSDFTLRDYDGNIGVFANQPDRNELIYLDIATGAERFRVSQEYIVQFVDISGGRSIHTGDIATVYDASTGEQLFRIEPPEGERSPYGAITENYVLTAFFGNDRFSLKVHDVATGTYLRDLSVEHEALPVDLAADGKFGVVAFQEPLGGGLQESWAEIFELETGKSIFKFESIIVDGPSGVRIDGNSAVFSPRNSQELDELAFLHMQVAHLTDNIPGDYDNDSIITANDIDLLNSVIRDGGTTFFDLDGNGSVNGVDRTKWVVEIANTYFGDSTLDGEFNSGDLVAIFEAGEYEDEIEGNSTWATGDWNGDGEFNTSDLVSAFEQGGYEKGPRTAQAVPEPSTSFALLVGFGTLIVFAGDRRRQTMNRHA